MRNNTKRTVFIITFLIIFIVGVFIGYKLIETANQSNGFKSQISEVSSQNQQKTELSADSNKNINQAPIKPVPDKTEPKSNNNDIPKIQTEVPKIQIEASQVKPPENIAPENKTKTCTISIQTADNIILQAQTIEIADGNSVFDILKKVTREKGIQMEFSGMAQNIYIKGIDNLYEFEKGPKSGWLYTVNKEFPQKSCGAYKLVGGEVIKWHYTLNMGEDIKQ